MTEHIHQQMQASNVQAGDVKQHYFGYCTQYDPVSHMAKFIIPMLRDENDVPAETNWCKLGTVVSGNGWGLQYAFKGGATAQNYTVGEQALINVSQRSMGIYTVSAICFNDDNQPPGMGQQGGSQPTPNSATDTEGSQQLQGGEFIWKHESGSFFKFYKNGDVRLFTHQSLYADVTKDLNVTVETGDILAIVKEGNATLDVKEGDVVVTVEEGDMNVNCTEGDFNVSAQNITMTAQQVATIHGIQTVTIKDGP